MENINILITLTMREINRHKIVEKLINRKISEGSARKMMGLKSVRQVRRIKKRVIAEGIEEIRHKSRGQGGNRKFSNDFIKKIMTIMKEKYCDFKATFASEKLPENHNIKINKESLRKLMLDEGLWKPKSRKQPKNHHVWRRRKDSYGEMEQFEVHTMIGLKQEKKHVYCWRLMMPREESLGLNLIKMKE